MRALLLVLLAAPLLADEVVWVVPVGAIDTGRERLRPGLIVFKGGKILALGTPDGVGAVPAGARDLRRMGGAPVQQRLAQLVIAPLVVDANTQRGAEGPLSELPLAPGLSALDAVDPLHPAWAQVAAAGIGLSVFAPDDRAVLAGKAVLLRPGATLLDLPLRREVALWGSIAPSSYAERDRPPSSRTEVLAALRAAFRAARKPSQPSEDYRDWRPDAAVLRDCLAGRLPLALRVGASGDVTHALALFAELGVRGVLVGGNEAVVAELPAIERARVPVILDPIRASDPDRLLALPAALARAGVRFAFSSRAPQSLESGLVDQAGLAVLHGLDPVVAWDALVAGPVDLLGLPDSTVLRAGGPADFAVYGGDPRGFNVPRLQLVRNGAFDPRALLSP